MRLALGAGAVVGVLAPAVGFFLVQRRQSLVGDGIGHVAFAGVAAGHPARRLPDPDRARRGGARRGRDRVPALAAAGRPATRRSRSSSTRASPRGVVLVSAAGALERRSLPVPVRLDPHRDAHRPGRHRARSAPSASRRSGCSTARSPAIVVDEEGARVAGRPDRRAERRRRGAGRGDGRALDARRRDPARGGAHGAPGERGDAGSRGACARRSCSRSPSGSPRCSPGSRSRTTPTFRPEERSCSSRRRRSVSRSAADALRGR